ncbi:HIR complex subunit [Ciborinia camelliae]|nr:HIR complex subunit [Ciborinia camelliae]
MGSNNSNSDLSSPPRSSPEMDDMQIRNDSNSITVNHSSLGASTSEKPTRKKAVRKPRPKAGDVSSATNTDAPKPKRIRKPRDPNAPPARPRKKATPSENTNGAESSRQTKITDAPGMRLSDTNFSVPATPPVQNSTITKSGESEAIPKSFFNSAPPQPQPQVAPPPQPQPQPQQQQSQMLTQPQTTTRTSGQNYDPIRSNYDPVRETLVNHHSYNNPQGSPILPQITNRASASPSISCLVDPPNQLLTSPSAHSFLMHQQRQQDGHNSLPASPIVHRLGQSAIPDSASPKMFPPTPTLTSQPMSAPTPPSVPLSLSQKEPQTSNSNSGKKHATNGMSGTSTPKPSAKGKEKEKEKETILLTPPPLPGSGLMQLGGNDGTETRAPTIVLDVPLNDGEVNVYVNFTRMAEETYGWDALHPRLAAQRDRLARVAAAGAALERNGSSKESGDEMSLDSEGEGSNVEMGGMSDGRIGTDGGTRKAKPKRKTKEDEYDKDDGFVDDSEMLWEQQAAAANDGFFVYSGPLVREGEKPTLDRGEGPAKKPRTRKAKVAGEKPATTSRASSGGKASGTSGGVGSRGGSTAPRKSRITKADRARMDQEKMEREQMGMAGMPGGYGTIQLAPSLGGTPMVFNQ